MLGSNTSNTWNTDEASCVVQFIFAEEGWTLGNVVSAVVGMLGALGVLTGAIAIAYARIKGADTAAKKQESDGWRSLVAAHEEQGVRREQNMQNLLLVLEMEQQHHIQCQRLAAQTKNSVYFLHEHCNRLHAELIRMGGNPGEQLKMPEISDLDSGVTTRSDFLARQIKQNVQEVKEKDKLLATQKAELEQPSENPSTRKRPSDVPPRRGVNESSRT